MNNSARSPALYITIRQERVLAVVCLVRTGPRKYRPGPDQALQENEVMAKSERGPLDGMKLIV
jgi:hypothetical protein